MENQLIREQVFDVLFNYVKIADGIFTESDCAAVRDEIMLKLDQSQFTADEAEEHINQEVERRIKERMPSEEESKKEADELFEGTNREFRKGMYSGFLFGIQWLRSHLTICILYHQLLRIIHFFLSCLSSCDVKFIYFLKNLFRYLIS